MQRTFWHKLPTQILQEIGKLLRQVNLKNSQKLKTDPDKQNEFIMLSRLGCRGQKHLRGEIEESESTSRNRHDK